MSGATSVINTLPASAAGRDAWRLESAAPTTTIGIVKLNPLTAVVARQANAVAGLWYRIASIGTIRVR